MNRTVARNVKRVANYFGLDIKRSDMPVNSDLTGDLVAAPNHKIIFGSHHKAGSTWIAMVFRKCCSQFNWRFFVGEQCNMPQNINVFVQDHSHFDCPKLGQNFRGMHLIRDPRDIIVSGCFYHQKSKEAWLHIPQDKFDGRTYQEAINDLPGIKEKILFEMENTGGYTIREMLAWNYENPLFIEVKYEDLIKDLDLVLFHRIFVFLGFPGSAIPDSLAIAYRNSLFSGLVKTNGGHIRSGKTSQWKAYFNRGHRQKFIEMFGDVLVRLGYEFNNDWVNGEDCPDK